MAKESFIGFRPRGGRRATPVTVAGVVEAEDGRQVEKVVTLWVAPLNSIDYARATDLARDLVADWIGLNGAAPRAPLDVPDGGDVPQDICRDVALLVIAQGVAKTLHASGAISLPDGVEDAPDFDFYNELELAQAVLVSHPIVNVARIVIEQVAEERERELKENPLAGSEASTPQIG